MDFLAILKSPITWAIAAAVAALITVAVIYHKGETAGAADVTVKVQQNTIKNQRDITDAESRGPRTPRDVSKRLRDGTF